MKLTNTKIQDTVREVIGEDSIDIIEFLKDKKNVSDFKIAEKVDRDIHEVRNILYRLYNHNLVSYYRKKDRQKGWYISYWTFNKKRVKELLEKTRVQKLEKFRIRLKEEEANVGNFYICPSAHIRVGFEKAHELEFRCPECASILNHQDNSRTIDFLREKINELQMLNGTVMSNVIKAESVATKKVKARSAKAAKPAKKVVKKVVKKVAKTAKKATKKVAKATKKTAGRKKK